MAQNILVNEVGFYPKYNKKAVFRGEGPVDFAVIDTKDNKVVFEGTSSDAIENKSADEINFILDFSDLKTCGEYYISVGNEKSVSFKIDSEVYKDATDKLLRFFYLQRCGMAVTEEYAGIFAHPSCHDTKARIYGTDKFIDVNGGWHDAGDYGRYIVPAANTIADLLIAIEHNPKLLELDLRIPESGNKMPDLLAEIKYELDWMLKMQDKESGKVYHKVTCASFCDFFMPEKETDELVVCEFSVTATADFAACMAMSAKFYDKYDAAFAATLREVSKKAYEAMKEISLPGGFLNPDGVVTGTYEDKCDRDEQYWAAAELYKEFGEEQYRKDFETLAKEQIMHGYGWEDMGSFGNLAYITTKYETDSELKSAIEKEMIERAEKLYQIAEKESYGISYTPDDYIWGSNMYVAENGSYLYDAYVLTKDEKYLKVARDHVDYLFGKNSCNVSFITGVGTNLIKDPHHRPSAAVKQAMPGMLIGGPNSGLMDPDAVKACTGLPPAKCFVDTLLSYSTNEETIYWNSALIMLMAQVF